MAPVKLTDEEVTARLADFPAWTREGNAITRTWRFPDYALAVLFTNAVAHVAEARDHHPVVTLAYREVRVAFTTVSARGITALDFALAREVDALPVRQVEP